MADYLHILAAIALLWFAATLTPGPDFLLASRVSMTLPREAALRVVLGIACGTVLWGLAGFFGIHVLFEAAPWLYLWFPVDLWAQHPSITGWEIPVIFNGQRWTTVRRVSSQ